VAIAVKLIYLTGIVTDVMDEVELDAVRLRYIERNTNIAILQI